MAQFATAVRLRSRRPASNPVRRLARRRRSIEQAHAYYHADPLQSRHVRFWGAFLCTILPRPFYMCAHNTTTPLFTHVLTILPRPFYTCAHNTTTPLFTHVLTILPRHFLHVCSQYYHATFYTCAHNTTTPLFTRVLTILPRPFLHVCSQYNHAPF